MTLIVTDITNLGIIQASDSNLTGENEGELDTGPKVFDLGFTPGAVVFAGSYVLDGQLVSEWLPRFIHRHTATYGSGATLEGFARHLARDLEREGSPDTGVMAHIAGYASTVDGSHPEMWFVRNFTDINDTTGAYEGRTETFQVTEDFWSRDHPEHIAKHGPGTRRRYFNGFPDGRGAYLALIKQIGALLEGAWAEPTWSFRPPETLDERAEYVRREIELIGTMFAFSEYPLPYIGGDVQISCIPPPVDAVAL